MDHKDIPEAAFGYVCANDVFLSGWGQSDGKNNRLIFPCDTPEDVDAVLENCNARSDFRRVTWSYEKPDLDLQANYYEVKTIDDYPRMFEAGYFS